MNKSNRILSDITVFMKYAKYIPETKRRETWDQRVFRNESMHVKKFPNLEKDKQLRSNSTNLSVYTLKTLKFLLKFSLKLQKTSYLVE